MMRKIPSFLSLTTTSSNNNNSSYNTSPSSTSIVTDDSVTSVVEEGISCGVAYGVGRKDEDRHVMCVDEEAGSFFAVFDGHGKAAAADLCVEEFERKVREGIRSGSSIAQAANKAAWELDEVLMDGDRRTTSGTTATFLWVDGDEATIGWIGDSAAVCVDMLSTSSDVQFATRIHTPDCPKEVALLTAVWTTRESFEELKEGEDGKTRFHLKLTALQEELLPLRRDGLLKDALDRSLRVDEVLARLLLKNDDGDGGGGGSSSKRANLDTSMNSPCASLASSSKSLGYDEFEEKEGEEKEGEEKEGEEEEPKDPQERRRRSRSGPNPREEEVVAEKRSMRRSRSRIGRRNHPRTGKEVGPPVLFAQYIIRDENGADNFVRGPSTQVTRSIGDWDAGRSLLPELDSHTWELGAVSFDRVIVASDGLWDVLTHAEAQKVAKKKYTSAQEAADRLLKAALVASKKMGLESYKDDTTVIVVDVKRGNGVVPHHKRSWKSIISASTSF